MQTLHQNIRRPAHLLAAAIALTTLLTWAACGSTAQPEPAAAPTKSHAMTGDSGGPQTEQHSSDASHSHGSNDADSTRQADTAAADAVVINMAITGRDSNLSRDDLQVKKGDTVNINFTADEEGEIHLHGYDLTAPVSLDSPGTLTFVADTAGAFGINFHVFGDGGTESGDSAGDHHHAPGVPDEVVSETPISLTVAAEADAEGSIDVHIETEGFRFARELVDQDHTPGTGHAHIYMDGEKLGRVFESEYRIADAPPGEHEVRVTLNTNDHSELVYNGKKLSATVTVNVPDVGQGHGDSHDHSDHDHGEHEVIAEVHLGNLEIYP